MRTQGSRSVLNEGVGRTEVLAWAMYDFANSGYTTVVITAVFNAYFVNTVAGDAEWATLAWTSGLSLSYLLILLVSPWVGAWADAHGSKKKLLAFTTIGCVMGTAGLAWVQPGDVTLALTFLVLSNLCFGLGENLIAAFLPELARQEGLGKVSGWGWGLGYLGGLISLGACLAYIGWQAAQGQSVTEAVPGTMLITALFFACASALTFLFLRERAQATGQGVLVSKLSLLPRALIGTRFLDMRRLMLCIVFYQAGIQAVIALAAVYAQQALGFGTTQTIELIVVVNIMAAVGAVVFGHWQDRIGHVRAIGLTLVGWLAMTALAFLAEGPRMFWVAAFVAGLCLGASQSAARALVGYLSPAHRQAEFFGLWGTAVKLSAIIGPMTYGLVTWLTSGNHRLAILATGVYFVVGLMLLTRIEAERGRQAALGG